MKFLELLETNIVYARRASQKHEVKYEIGKYYTVVYDSKPSLEYITKQCPVAFMRFIPETATASNVKLLAEETFVVLLADFLGNPRKQRHRYLSPIN